jgi:hypothetical protein
MAFFVSTIFHGGRFNAGLRAWLNLKIVDVKLVIYFNFNDYGAAS